MNITNTTSQTKREDTYTKRGREYLQAVAICRANYETLPASGPNSIRSSMLSSLSRLEKQIKKDYLQSKYV
jgi:hypothetical protein